jgi:hypothetical protein
VTVRVWRALFLVKLGQEPRHSTSIVTDYAAINASTLSNPPAWCFLRYQHGSAAAHRIGTGRCSGRHRRPIFQLSTPESARARVASPLEGLCSFVLRRPTMPTRERSPRIYRRLSHPHSNRTRAASPVSVCFKWLLYGASFCSSVMAPGTHSN